MSAESPRHARSGGPLTVPSQPPSDRSIIDAVSGFINDVTLSSSSTVDPKDVIQWARFETTDINEPTPEGDSDNDISPLLLILGYGSGVQVWLIPPTGEAQEVLSWRQGTVRVLRILPTPQHGDCFVSKRPLIALCDSASPGPTFCSLSFISIRGGEQVKSIKFKNPILDVLANKRSVVVSFSERFAVFDAATLEDRMAVTTCYPCPCPLGGNQPINPLALGDRWLAYADKKLNQSKRSSGGCEGEGVTSYTATVLHAAKSLSKGLRGLGESVAHSLAGGRSTSQSPSPPNADMQQPGVVTILDIEGNEEEDGQEVEDQFDPIVAHFVAHSDAIIALKFDSSGMLLVTADRRGHDFHVFRINPHPCGPSLASVHHLYVLHRGDTTAKVQDIAISQDGRWTAVSTLRGTTHVFATSAYGGACGVRTHTSPRVVNRLSRFHRSAGLPIHAHAHQHQHNISGSPVSEGLSHGAWFPNPRLPPYPQPVTVSPLAQLRPTASLPTHTITRTSSGRQRLSSMSEESLSVPLLARARFGLAWPTTSSSTGALSRPAPAALYLVAASGCLSHLALHPRPARNIPKEKICDDSPIELEVEPIAQWPLQRPPVAADLLAPLPPSNPLLQPLSCRRCADICMSEEERWLSQVEIVTHAGPHRRLWMGPQFVFKTYNCTGSNSSLSEAETVEVDTSASRGVARSNPVNMPGVRPVVPVLIDSGSASECSLEHSPSDSYRRKSLLAETGRAASVCDVQLKEDLAEAMKEDQGCRSAGAGDAGDAGEVVRGGAQTPRVSRAVDPLGTVVTPPRARPAPSPPDPDQYTSSNADEGTFRPVVRAPAALRLHPDMVVRPLPRTTTIPVQTVPPAPHRSPDDPLPLATHVTIPAELSANTTGIADWTALDSPPDDSLTFQLDHHSPRPTPSVVEVPVVVPARRDPSATNLSKTPVTRGAEVSELRKDETVHIDVEEGNKVDKYNTQKRSLSTIGDSTAQKIVNKETDTSLKQKNIAAKVKESDRDVRQLENKTDKTQRAKQTTLDKLSKQKIDDQLQQTKTSERIKRAPIETATNLDRFNVDIKQIDVNKDLKKQEIDARKRDSAHERSSAERAERNSDDSKSLPKSNRASDDIQPIARIRLKKSPTPKSVSDRDSEVSIKDNKTKKSYESKEVIEPKVVKETKEIKKQKDVSEIKVIKEFKESIDTGTKEFEQAKEDKHYPNTMKDIKKEGDISKSEDNAAALAVTLKLPFKKEKSKKIEVDIKTEEQAWDLLLNEPENPVSNISNELSTDKSLEDKVKSKRNRKLKKVQDDPQAKSEDDSFVEIHTIEEKQPSSGDLVSISTPFENIEPTTLYLTKTKKSRSTKSSTPEKRDDTEKQTIKFSQIEPELSSNKPRSNKKYEMPSDIEVIPEPIPVRKEIGKETDNTLRIKKHYDGTASESNSFIIKDVAKPLKSKSLSPYPEPRKLSEKPVEPEEKDVYVINTTEDDFPEIQITRGTKTRKRSPQPIEMKSQEKEPVEKPVKSWSSIAASKSVKKYEDAEKKVENIEKKVNKNDRKDDLKDVASALDENPVSSTTVSLQDKLIELCKRTDIMVAECDAPSELNFVEEHHAVLQDLPPLEPLDFALDDFKLEVMRDSLLEVNDAKVTSPICKINIDDILSSIKETTTKVIESSSFNLIDLEKVPARKEKGFSVIESDKITTQEVKLDDDGKPDDGEVLEKSSDEDVTTSTSDKEDKKNAGASNIILPSSKQSAKSKKSRRKKK